MCPHYYMERFSSNREAAEFLNSMVAGRKTIIIVCECRVEYRGRSRSILPWGERIIIIKQDGAVLVHRPKGYSPVNWQPSTSKIVFENTEEGLLMKAVRATPRETMYVYFREIYDVIAYRLKDNAKFTMYASEEEIKNILETYPEMIERGLRITGREIKVPQGYIDFIGRDKEGRMVVIEVKDEKAGLDAGKQLLKYVRYFREKGAPVRGIILAPSFSKPLLEFLDRNNLEKRKLDVDKILTLLREKSIDKARPAGDLREFL